MMFSLSPSTFLRCTPPTVRFFRQHSTATPVVQSSTKQNESGQNTTDYSKFYMRISALFGATAGAIGGGIFGNWCGELENNHPNNRYQLSDTSKKVNLITYRTGGIAAGAFLGFVAGPSIPPFILIYGTHLLIDKLEHPN